MQIIKRSGQTEAYDASKIERAIAKSFEATATTIDNLELKHTLQAIENVIFHKEMNSVECIQDLVEETLMLKGYFPQAKAYILYRSQRQQLREARVRIANEVGIVGLEEVLRGVQKDFLQDRYSLGALESRFISFIKSGMSSQEKLNALIRAAVELTTQDSALWVYIAARFASFGYHTKIEQTRKQKHISSLYETIRALTDVGLYGSYILEHYTKAEIDYAQSFIDNARDYLFDFAGYDLICRRYVIHGFDGSELETPQEMFLGVALHLAMKEEASVRMEWVKRFYDMLSMLKVTMATPTLSNARKPHHQLSSCFIDTVPDSLEGIYRSIDNFAQVSKFGGGMGMYLGKVRAQGSSIRGFKGAAGGVIRWIRVINDTAVAVDQLGMRSGAVAVYLDVWHRDLPEFLQIRTNNGDDRTKAHDVFPAVCYPDYFWELAEQSLDNTWYLMDPHEISVVKGYALEDSYGDVWLERYLDCVEDPRISKRTIVIKDLVRLIIKSAVETGTPFAFMRDTVNRANPNSHKGIIYCSNLCTEIAQNTSEIQQVSQEIQTSEGDTVVVTQTRPGDFVVCNLASLSLGNIALEDDEELGSIVEACVRALDNVIDLNFYALPYAKITNHRYRAIGLGVSGYHHMLAKRHISWESEEHLQFADDVFERIAYHAIQASSTIAQEKGSYKYFEGSDWHIGAYFTKRGYVSEKWKALKEQVTQSGMRNAYLMAVAPTSSTSILAGTTAGIDPIMNKFFLEEKKGMMLARVAPELNTGTFWYYKPAHLIDQMYSIKACAIRQRHIDQAQSMNLYITNDFTMRQVFNLYVEAWKQGVKTIYYVRSKSLEVEECESCSA